MFKMIKSEKRVEKRVHFGGPKDPQIFVRFCSFFFKNMPKFCSFFVIFFSKIFKKCSKMKKCKNVIFDHFFHFFSFFSKLQKVKKMKK